MKPLPPVRRIFKGSSAGPSRSGRPIRGRLRSDREPRKALAGEEMTSGRWMIPQRLRRPETARPGAQVPVQRSGL
jgi:hypothetical protein